MLKSKAAWLLDFYAELLPQTTARVLHDSLEEDLSLAEIASQEGMSRQAIHDRLQRGLEQLEHYEEKLGLLARYQWEEQWLKKMQESLAKQDWQQLQDLLAVYERER